MEGITDSLSWIMNAVRDPSWVQVFIALIGLFAGAVAYVLRLRQKRRAQGAAEEEVVRNLLMFIADRGALEKLFVSEVPGGLKPQFGRFARGSVKTWKTCLRILKQSNQF